MQQQVMQGGIEFSVDMTSSLNLEPQWLIQIKLFEPNRQLWHLLIVTLPESRSRLLQRLS